MMTMRKIAQVAFAEPFRPFRILMEDGAIWHVQDPDMIAIGKTKVFLDTWMSDIEEEAKTRELALLMSQITSIQFLEGTHS